MPKNFVSLRMHVADESAAGLADLGTRPLRRRRAARGAARGAAEPESSPPSFNNDEAAARHYLSRLFDRDARPTVRSLTAPERPEVVPELHVVDVRSAAVPALEVAATKDGRGVARSAASRGHKLVCFEQTRSNIPVFGSRAIVELGEKRELISINATVANVRGVSAVAALSPANALARIADAANVAVASLEAVDAPSLTFYDDDENSWHLAYFFKNVAAAPKELLESAPGEGSSGTRGRHGLGRSPRDLRPRVNYLVDAHDGAILFYYSATPMVVLCRGDDDLGVKQRFYGTKVETAFEMYDQLRSVRTFDLAGEDLEGDLPKIAIRSNASDPFDAAPGVSAHVNGVRVQQFFADVLGRHGIDDKGMELVSIVNCTYAADQPPPEWHNAIWYDNRMWYGRAQDGAGKMRSFARYLDIIAHELTHGVTEHSAGLVYKGQSGALDESISDIFGTIIKNWYTVGPDSDVGGWNWEFGSGLGDAGKPLRSMSDPPVTGDPDHMDGYLTTKNDNGGVHTNSNIHNKAAYNLLTATEPVTDKRAMQPSDVAVLYYLALQRLSKLSDFSDMRNALLEVAKTYYGKPSERTRMVAHIESAYDRVGIS